MNGFTWSRSWFHSRSSLLCTQISFQPHIPLSTLPLLQLYFLHTIACAPALVPLSVLLPRMKDCPPSQWVLRDLSTLMQYQLFLALPWFELICLWPSSISPGPVFGRNAFLPWSRVSCCPAFSEFCDGRKPCLICHLSPFSLVSVSFHCTTQHGFDELNRMQYELCEVFYYGEAEPI